MEKFINASSVEANAKGEKDLNKMNIFISKFNNAIQEGTFTLNDGLDSIPSLNDTEFSIVEKMAKEEGWTLTRFDDNYNTTSYKIEKSK
ncbi:MAG: hypothetical protein IPJ01_10380 [Micavibrio sp.]|nr:hypothetical protein [Micavibrio sp.]